MCPGNQGHYFPRHDRITNPNTTKIYIEMTSAYRLKNVSYRYGNTEALSLPILSIQAKQTTALLGPNGSGKSTLLHLLAFLTTASAGEIFFHDVLVGSADLPGLRKRIGFLAQKPYMLRGTVLDNIHLTFKLRGIAQHLWQQKSSAVLERLQISHCAGQQARQLSGGELQKAALARILAVEPEILILDEPFSFLDQASAQRLEKQLTGYLAETGATLIFSTHNRLQGFALADEVVSLVKGKRVESPLINLFHGQVNEHHFDTGKLQIMLPDDIATGNHASIDPHEIVLSRQPLSSSIRNHYNGRVITIAEEMGKVRVSIDAGELFQALITYQALSELRLSLGGSVWINFKSNSVVVF